jgi:urease accessory protein
MKQSVHRTLLFATTLLALPTAAQAHLTGTGLGPFYDGVTHFFLSAEQIIPVLALALFAGLRGKRSGRITLFLLPGAWLVGGFAGLARPIIGQFSLLACFSFLVLGSLVAADANLPPRFVAALAFVFGVALGYVNGSDLSTTNVGALGLLGTATSIFVVTALVSAFVASLRVPWTRIVVRVAGSWIVAAGLLLLGWTFHSNTPKLRSQTSAIEEKLSHRPLSRDAPPMAETRISSESGWVVFRLPAFVFRIYALTRTSGFG